MTLQWRGSGKGSSMTGQISCRLSSHGFWLMIWLGASGMNLSPRAADGGDSLKLASSSLSGSS
jgi:hypothetical protein